MATKKKSNTTKEVKQNNFGTIYTQFENKPVQAIKHLLRKKEGECTKAFYRKDIGYIDIVWGKVTDPVKHKGYGLAHIVDKHEADIKKLGFDVANFIATVVQYGNLSLSKSKEEYLLESETFRVVIETKYKGSKKNWILTAFDLQQKKAKK
ncbi:MAG: hypothetical protein IKJ52_00045 [Muribaculaceae bacterium]|nr:hypothetical protein [Muribaculaceae bacterium]